MSSEPRRQRKPAQVEEMLKRAAAASFEAPNRAMKRRIRQRLHKKLGLMVSGEDFDKAIERFHILEASKEGQVCQVQDDGRFSWEGAWPLCAIQDVKPLEEKAMKTIRVEGMTSLASHGSDVDYDAMRREWMEALNGRLPVQKTFVQFGLHFQSFSRRRSRSL
mmetsp:Transcript_18399/g.31278  ORF Transcript_18399/g.31278 Transcript_18399/m.31278 type:complete len:163 (-) Transcript_18399:26-514(-)